MEVSARGDVRPRYPGVEGRVVYAELEVRVPLEDPHKRSEPGVHLRLLLCPVTTRVHEHDDPERVLRGERDVTAAVLEQHESGAGDIQQVALPHDPAAHEQVMKAQFSFGL